MRSIYLVVACIAAVVALSPQTKAQDFTFTHTWTGTEVLQGPNRYLRNGVPSVFGVPKPFPGVFAQNPTLFATLFFFADPGSKVNVTTTLIDGVFSFLALHDTAFDPLNLATNYLGDAGSSDLNSFSVTAPASGQLVLVANSVGTPAAVTGMRISAIISVPEPTSLALLGIGTCVASVVTPRRRRREMQQVETA